MKVKNGDVNYSHEGLVFDGYDIEFTTLDGKLTLDGVPQLVSTFTFDGAPDEDPTKQPEEDEEGEEEGEEGEDDETTDPDETTSYIENTYVPNSIKIVCEKGNITIKKVEPKVEEPESNDTTENGEGVENNENIENEPS